MRGESTISQTPPDEDSPMTMFGCSVPERADPPESPQQTLFSNTLLSAYPKLKIFAFSLSFK